LCDAGNVRCFQLKRFSRINSSDFASDLPTCKFYVLLSLPSRKNFSIRKVQSLVPTNAAPVTKPCAYLVCTSKRSSENWLGACRRPPARLQAKRSFAVRTVLDTDMAVALLIMWGKKPANPCGGLGHLMCRGSRSLSLSRKSDIACAALLRSYSYRGRRHTLAQVFRTLKVTFVGSAGIAATGTPTSEEYRSFRLVGTGDGGYESFTTIFRWS